MPEVLGVCDIAPGTAHLKDAAGGRCINFRPLETVELAKKELPLPAEFYVNPRAATLIQAAATIYNNFRGLSTEAAITKAFEIEAGIYKGLKDGK